MTLRLALLVLVIALQGPLPQEPDEYPAGQFCTPKGINYQGVQTTDHPCACKRMDHSADCEGVPEEDAVCQQWCHKQHCGCPVACDAKHH